MSGINTPFPVDSKVLGKNVVGPIFNPSSHPANCFAQGVVKKDGTLHPSVTSRVIKFEGLDSGAGSPLSIFGLQGQISASAGVMSSKSSPATALAATFTSDGHVSRAVFGTIEPVTQHNIRIHSVTGIHASFGPDSASAKWRCTKVVIGNTFWAPWVGCTKVTDVVDSSKRIKEEPFFCHDFTTDETYVQIEKFDERISINQWVDETVPGYIYKITLRPDGTIDSRNISGTGTPSVVAVARAETMLRECNALLQSKMDAIKWLEDARVERHENPERQVEYVFFWMHKFQESLQMPTQRPHIFGNSLMPGMSALTLKKLMHNPANARAGIYPCKCTPMNRDPMCNNDLCRFKYSRLLLTQANDKKPVLDRFEAAAQAAQAAAQAAAKAAAAAKAKKEMKQQKALEAEAAARSRSSRSSAASVAAARSPAVSKFKKPDFAASVAASSKSTVKKTNSSKKPASAASVSAASARSPAVSKPKPASASASASKSVQPTVKKTGKKGGSKKYKKTCKRR